MIYKREYMSLKEFHIKPKCSWLGTSIWNNPEENKGYDIVTKCCNIKETPKTFMGEHS